MCATTSVIPKHASDISRRLLFIQTNIIAQTLTVITDEGDQLLRTKNVKATTLKTQKCRRFAHKLAEILFGILISH
jgi:negative regulator of replication initiation